MSNREFTVAPLAAPPKARAAHNEIAQQGRLKLTVSAGQAQQSLPPLPPRRRKPSMPYVSMEGVNRSPVNGLNGDAVPPLTDEQAFDAFVVAGTSDATARAWSPPAKD